MDKPLPSILKARRGAHCSCRLKAWLLSLLCWVSVLAYADEISDPPLDAALNEQILNLPGDPARPVTLQVTLFKPNGLGPFPLAVLNHGKDIGDAHNQARNRQEYAVHYFVSRGYAVILPMLRGFAGSGGVFTGSCNVGHDGLQQAQDIRAVIKDMAQFPDIDSHRVIVFGQSFGGWNTLALGVLNLPEVKGLIDVVGGRNAPSCRAWESDLVDAAGYYGKLTHVPSLWFYGDNDSIFSVPTWRAMYQRYTDAGGKAELVAYGTFMSDSHKLLGMVEGLPIWIPRVDAFLASVGLPNQNLHPELLPMEYPPASDFAALNDVNAVPFLTDKTRQSYPAFLNLPMPRVFEISPDGSAVSVNGGYDPLERALSLCKKHNLHCSTYAIDEHVVWRAPTFTPIPPASHFATLDDVNAIPYLNDKGRQNYQTFLAQEKPRVFVIAPNGAHAYAHGGNDPLGRILALCKRRGIDCTPYAIDDTVVWPGVAKP